MKILKMFVQLICVQVLIAVILYPFGDELAIYLSLAIFLATGIIFLLLLKPEYMVATVIGYSVSNSYANLALWKLLNEPEYIYNFAAIIAIAAIVTFITAAIGVHNK